MADPISWEEVQGLLGEVRAMAQHLLRLENSALPLTPTDLLQTAVRRLIPEGQDLREITWKNRAYFFGAVRQAMRRALIDYARGRNAKKRPTGRAVRLEDLHFDDLVLKTKDHQDHPEQVEALMEALERLRAKQPEWSKLVEHRYFTGYTIEETAHVMDVAKVTIRRWWIAARTWLHKEMLRILNEENPEEAP